MALTTNGITKNGIEKATASALGTEDAKTLWNRYEYTRFGDNVKNELIEDILTRYDNLLQTHKNYVETHQQEREANRNSLDVIQGLQQSVDYLQGLLNRDPFILVLVDGNGMIFHHNFLKQGEAGGQAAAITIETAVLAWAREYIPDTPSDTKIVVRLYANVRAVAEACAKAGIVEHPTRVFEFIRAFNSTNPLFDFVDVGAAKDAADEKVVGSLKLYVYNYYCRHVLFGGSHNESYSSALQPYMKDVQAKARITLLEGVPFGQAMTALPLPRKKIPGIFRDTKIAMPPLLEMRADPRARVGSNTSLNAASSVFTPRTTTPTNLSSPFGSVTSLDQHLVRVDSADAQSDSGSGTWATVTRRNAHNPMRDLVASTPNGSVASINRNKKGQRIDKELLYNREEVQRIKKLKSCNQHYIGVGCCHYNAGKADKCPHNHHYDFTPAELRTLRVVARETPCKKGHECEDPNCIYGHQCPFPLAVEGSLRGSGQCLNGENCRFPASMHGVDQAAIKITRVTGL